MKSVGKLQQDRHAACCRHKTSHRKEPGVPANQHGAKISNRHFLQWRNAFILPKVGKEKIDVEHARIFWKKASQGEKL
jgi:hypothetical protein